LTAATGGVAGLRADPAWPGAGGALDVIRGPVTRPDAELVTDPRTFISLLYGDQPRAEAGATVRGQAGVLERLLHG
jgi:hypothetical protein